MSDINTYYIPGANPEHVPVGAAFVLLLDDDLVQYPANWLALAGPDDLAAIGAVEVADEGVPGDPRYYINTTTLVGPLRTITATARPLADVQAALLAYMADRRWEAEIGGTSWNGWGLPTDERSQQKYAAEALAVQLGNRDDGSPWKFPHGFEALANAQVIAMATAARAHVLACYAREAALAAQIGAGTLTTFAAIDAAFPPPEAQ